ncbi:phospholipid-translocating P-type ATPase, flippase family protein (macronuclear) [Tetrahymena thermophila SB210]|uniref:histidine kinase n=1 Tax=Tetrahymena thermophila (strain SB210) TaxID=312017 RepID=Q23UD2_TETTS|nr:phospholipid-translocating P-type ATPase, flippase family protein [Tetrahymena thermophila SB210]EAS00133.2 phospholipid-translocating P-type ATPase, flippase family protein [Tetrahymena thermophila SB210]|eukprot:XP_001020378.2 phospholipid-translocating P-type ATPase, flippase family protein [Tetrahymena thermophila SB210]
MEISDQKLPKMVISSSQILNLYYSFNFRFFTHSIALMAMAIIDLVASCYSNNDNSKKMAIVSWIQTCLFFIEIVAICLINTGKIPSFQKFFQEWQISLFKNCLCIGEVSLQIEYLMQEDMGMKIMVSFFRIVFILATFTQWEKKNIYRFLNLIFTFIYLQLRCITYTMDSIASRINLLLLFLIFLQTINGDVQHILDSPHLISQEQDLILTQKRMTFSEQNYQNPRQNTRGITFGGSLGGLFSFINKPKTMTNSSISKECQQQGKTSIASNHIQNNGTHTLLANEVNQKGLHKNGQQINEQHIATDKNGQACYQFTLQTNGPANSENNTSSNLVQNTEQFTVRKNLEKSLTAKFGSPKLVCQQNSNEVDDINLSENNNEDFVKIQNANSEFCSPKTCQEYSKQRKKSNFQMYATQENSKENHQEIEDKQIQKPNKSHQDLQTSVLSPDFLANRKNNKNENSIQSIHQYQNSKMIEQEKQSDKRLQEIKLFKLPLTTKDEENYAQINQIKQNYQSQEYSKNTQISISPKSIQSYELSLSPVLQLSVPNNSQFYQMFFQILPEGILLLGSKQNKVHVQNRMLERLMNIKGGSLIDKFFKLENNLNLGETSDTSGTLDILPMIMNMKTILNESTSQQRISSIQQLNQNILPNQQQNVDSKMTQPSQFQPKPQAGSDNDERTNTQGSNNQIPSMPNVSILQLEDPKYNQQAYGQSLQNSPSIGQQQNQIDESILSKSNLKYIPQPIRQNMNQKLNMNAQYNNNIMNRKEKDLAEEQIIKQIDQQRSQFTNDMQKEYSNSYSSNLNQSAQTQNNIDVTYSRKKTIGELYRSLIKEIQQDIEMNGSASKYEAFEHQVKMICSFPYIKKKRTSNSNLKSQFNISQMAYSNMNLNIQSVSNVKSDTSENVENCKKIFEVTCIPCIIEGQPSVLFVVKDVTHFNQIKLLKHINKNKSQMLSQVAHEFRTPLNCIISMMDLASITNPQSQIQQYLKPALTSAKQLNSMVNDLLDLAQLKAGKFSLNMESFNLQELISQIVVLMSIQSEQKGLALISNIDPQIPNSIYSDPNRLRQIIINLVGNSLKFTKKGSITIKASLISTKVIKISIIDTGIGIKEEDMANLFQAFGKIAGQEQKQLNPNGVGLGLMISHVLAKNLGEGEGLKVESQVGIGTEFYFEIVNNLQKMNIDKSFILKSQIVKSQYYKKSQIASMKIDQQGQQQQYLQQQQLQYQQQQQQKQQQQQFIQKPQNQVNNDDLKKCSQNYNFDDILKTFGKIDSYKDISGQENKVNKQEEWKENGHQQQSAQKRKPSIQLHNSSKLKNSSIPSQNTIYTPKSNSCNQLAGSLEDHQPDMNGQANLSISASLNQMLNLKQTKNQIITIHEEEGEYEGDGSANFNNENSQKFEERDHLIKRSSKSQFSNHKNQFYYKDQIGPKVQLNRCHIRNESVDYDGCGENFGFLSDRPNQQNASDSENIKSSFEKILFPPNQKKFDISGLLNQNQNNNVVNSNIQKLQVQSQLDNLIGKNLNNVEDLHDSSSDDKESSVADDENLNDSFNGNFKKMQNNSDEQKQQDSTYNQGQPDKNSDKKDNLKKRTQKRYKTKIKRSSSQVEFFESSHKSVSQSLSASVQAEVEILTIDDNEFNNMVLKMHIERLIRARVHCAIDAHDALSKLQEQYTKTKSGFDLIFLDLSMPEIDGYGTFSMIKDFCNEKRINQNVVACTGYSSLEEKDKCIDIGMVDYILKPIEIPKLKEVLSIFLDGNAFNK